MAYRYEFDPACARDLRKLTRRDVPLLLALVIEHLPAILRDPYALGEKKRGKLANVRAYNFRAHNVAYRLVYGVHQEVVVLVSVGPHDAAYDAAERRV